MIKQENEDLDEYDKMVEKFPNEPFVYFCRGIDRLKKRRHEVAIKDFNKIININPNNYYAYYLCARAYLFLNQIEQVKNNIKTALEIEPSFDLAKAALKEILEAEMNGPLCEDDYPDDCIVSFKSFKLGDDNVSMNYIRKEKDEYFEPLNIQIESSEEDNIKN